jgi:hypothetical protein
MSHRNIPVLMVLWETVPDHDCEEHVRRIVEIVFADPKGGVDEQTSPPQNKEVGPGESNLPK